MEPFLIYLLKSGTLISLFYLVYFFLLRKDTFFVINRHFLLLGIITALLLPFLEFTTTKFIEKPNFEFLDVDNTSQIITMSETNPIPWWQIISILYIVGVVLFLTRFGFQLVSLQRLVADSNNKQSNTFNFIETDQDIAPFSFFKSIVYNPSLHSLHELEMILAHEKVHAKQHHSIDLLIANLLMIFQWFNPIAWLYKKSLEQNLEFIADQEAIRDSPSKKQYQLTLVKVSSSNQAAIANNFYQSLIKKRIIMLNKQTSKRQNLWKLFIILPLLSLFLWSFNTKEVIKVKERKKSSVTHENQSHDNPYTKSIEHSIKFILNKNTSKEELEKIKETFKNMYQVDINFGNIKRNNNNEITGIKIDVSSKKSNANYAIKNESPIATIVISYDSKTDDISIGNSKHSDLSVWTSKHGKKNKNRTEVIEIHPDNDENHEFIFIGNGQHQDHYEIETDDTKTFAFLSGDLDKEPLIIIDGKEATKEEMKKIDSKKIATIDVSKGKSAIKKYGDKAKNGVVEIILKKN